MGMEIIKDLNKKFSMTFSFIKPLASNVQVLIDMNVLNLIHLAFTSQ